MSCNYNYVILHLFHHILILQFFLANLPLFIVGNRTKRNNLTLKLTKLQNDTYELINLNMFNEIATLEMYLLLEMGLRCAYSKWLGEKIVISKYGEKDIKLKEIISMWDLFQISYPYKKYRKF